MTFLRFAILVLSLFIQSCSFQNEFSSTRVRFEGIGDELETKSFEAASAYDYACLTYQGGGGTQTTKWYPIKKSGSSLSVEFEIPNLQGGSHYQFTLIGLDSDVVVTGPPGEFCPKNRPTDSGWAQLGYARVYISATLPSVQVTIPFVFKVGESDTLPDAPRSLLGVPGDGRVSLIWVAPAGIGIFDYVIQYASENSGGWTTVVHDPSSNPGKIVSGLTNGTPYIFRVAAVNAVGQGAWSANSNLITPTSNPVSIFISQWKTDNTSSGSSASNQITLPLESDGTYNFTVEWGDGTSNNITTWNDAKLTHTYPSAGTYNVSITGTITGFRFSNAGDVLKLINIGSFGPLRLGNNGGYFFGAKNLTITATDSLDLTGTTNLSEAFSGCISLTYVLSMARWQTANVTNMSGMFYKASAFNWPIGNWDTSNVRDMSYMFTGASVFNQPIGNWNTANVKDMSFMFYKSTAFDQPIDTWNITSVTNMENIVSSTSFSVTNYDNLLISWSQQAVQTGVNFGSIGVKHSNTSTVNSAYHTLTVTKGWLINEPALLVEPVVQPMPLGNP